MFFIKDHIQVHIKYMNYICKQSFLPTEARKNRWAA